METSGFEFSCSHRRLCFFYSELRQIDKLLSHLPVQVDGFSLNPPDNAVTFLFHLCALKVLKALIPILKCTLRSKTLGMGSWPRMAKKSLLGIHIYTVRENLCVHLWGHELCVKTAGNFPDIIGEIEVKQRQASWEMKKNNVLMRPLELQSLLGQKPVCLLDFPVTWSTFPYYTSL